jgi:hypothetical protein
MPPHPLFPKLEASVLVDGRPVIEHSDRDDANAVTKVMYIEAQAGELFGIRYFIPGYLFEDHSIKVIVNIDGVDMRKSIFEKRRYDYYGISRHVYDSSALIGNNYVGQRFRFAELYTSKSSHSVWVPHS